MIRKLGLLFLLGLITQLTSAQTFVKAWKKAMQPFYQECFDIEIGLTVYKNSLRLGISEQTQLRYQKCGKQMLLTSAEYDQFINEKLVIIADHREQALMVGPMLSKGGASPRLGLDSLFALTEGMFKEHGFVRGEPELTSTGQKVFVFENPDKLYKRAEFWFNKELTEIRKIVLIPSPMMKPGLNERKIPAVEYTFTYAHQVLQNDVFNISRFIEKSGKKYIPNKRFSKYTFINQL